MALGLVWGVSFSVVKVGSTVVPPAALVAARFGIGTLTLLAARPRALTGLRRSTAVRGIALGALLGSGYLLHTYGLTHTSVVVASFVTALAVVVAPPVAWLWFGRIPSRRQLAAIGVGGAGVCLLLCRRAGFSLGDVLVATAAVVWAVHLVALERWTAPGEVYPVAVVQLATVTVLAAGTQIARGGVRSLQLGPLAAVTVLALGVVATGGALLVLTWAQTRVDASTSAVLLTLEPVSGAATGVLRGETLSTQTVVGALLLLVAVLVACQFRPRSSRGCR